MIQRAFGHAGRLVVLGLCTAVAVLVAATASSAATSVNVACGDSAGLVAGVNTVNAAGGATTRTVLLLTPEEVDAAAKRSVEYRPPGG